MMKLEISKSLLLTPLRKLINIVSPFSPSENAVNGRGGGGWDIKWNGPHHFNDTNLWNLEIQWAARFFPGIENNVLAPIG